MPTAHQLRRAQKFERKAGRVGERAGKLEERAAKVREQYTRPSGEVGPRAERRATRIEDRAAGRRSRETELQQRSTALAPALTPESDTSKPTPTIPDESGYHPDPNAPPGGGGVQPPPWAGPQDPRPPYQPFTPGFNPMQQTATPGTEQLIAPYYVGAGPTGQRYEEMLTNEYGGIEGRTTNRFADMFSKYVDVANREANRQAGQIGSALGSRGALYSSANLAQQANLRERTSQDIANTAQQYQTQLEDQRQRAFGTVLQGQGNLAQAEYGAREAGMARAWQDFMRQSDIPPEYAAGTAWASGRPSGQHYAY